jgi:hypothetical protein
MCTDWKCLLEVNSSSLWGEPKLMKELSPGWKESCFEGHQKVVKTPKFGIGQGFVGSTTLMACAPLSDHAPKEDDYGVHLG